MFYPFIGKENKAVGGSWNLPLPLPHLKACITYGGESQETSSERVSEHLLSPLKIWISF